jgi:hypothetical protein
MRCRTSSVLWGGSVARFGLLREGESSRRLTPSCRGDAEIGHCRSAQKATSLHLTLLPQRAASHSTDAPNRGTERRPRVELDDPYHLGRTVWAGRRSRGPRLRLVRDIQRLRRQRLAPPGEPRRPRPRSWVSITAEAQQLPIGVVSNREWAQTTHSRCDTDTEGQRHGVRRSRAAGH